MPCTETAARQAHDDFCNEPSSQHRAVAYVPYFTRLFNRAPHK